MMVGRMLRAAPALLVALATLSMGGCPESLQSLFGQGLFGNLFGGIFSDPNSIFSDPNSFVDDSDDGGGGDNDDGDNGNDGDDVDDMDDQDDDEPANRAPTANAGSDTSVLRGANVTLGGAGADPDGDTLTYAWRQTGGTEVELTNANSAAASFRAPSVAGALRFELTVSDGKSSARDTVVIVVTVPPAILFIANNDSGRVTSHSSDALDGEIEPATALDPGAATSLFQVRSILVTPAGVLFATRQNGGIVIFDDALSADAAAPADRVVEGNNTLLEAPISLAYDADNDRLFVGNVNTEVGVLVFDGVSKAAFDGAVAPDRTFVPPDRFPITGSIQMTVDALWFDEDTGELYVSDTSGLNVNSSRILVFDNPGAADGETAPVRTITSAAFGHIEDIVVDKAGRLYVVDGLESVHVFDDAASLDGDVTPDRTITLNRTPTAELHGVGVDSDGDGYLSDRNGDAVYTIEDIGSADGAVTPDATLEGFETRIAGPRQMWVFEE